MAWKGSGEIGGKKLPGKKGRSEMEGRIPRRTRRQAAKAAGDVGGCCCQGELAHRGLPCKWRQARSEKVALWGEGGDVWMAAGGGRVLGMCAAAAGRERSSPPHLEGAEVTVALGRVCRPTLGWGSREEAVREARLPGGGSGCMSTWGCWGGVLRRGFGCPSERRLFLGRRESVGEPGGEGTRRCGAAGGIRQRMWPA